MVTKQGKQSLVPRPPKKSEYQLMFATVGAQKGRRDLVATTRNAMTDTWDFLTRTPTTVTQTNYPLKGELATIRRGRREFQPDRADPPAMTVFTPRACGCWPQN